MIPVILSGGSGSRFWPLSRPHHPKQFIAFHNQQTLYQNTLSRLSALNVDPFIIMCNEHHRFIVAESTRELGLSWEKIILEPFGRNTAPAIMIAALHVLQTRGEDAVLLVLPADHIIKDESAFIKATQQAERAAFAGHIVTFGIQPTSAHTGYGYIQSGEKIDHGLLAVKSFKEKPDTGTAQQFISQGNYLWNSGIYAFKASVFIDEIKKYHPDILECARKALAKAKEDFDFLRLDQGEFGKCPDISIDYAIMEHTDKAVVLTMDAGWSDVGSWDSVWELSDKDVHGNVCKGDVIALDTQNSYIHAENKLVTILGLKDLIVIGTQDAIMIANKSHAQDIKKIVDEMKSNDRHDRI